MKEGIERREWMQQAACVATTCVAAWATAGAVPALANPGGSRGSEPGSRRFPKSLLVDAFGNPFTASKLKGGEAHLFTYPYVASPVFIVDVGRTVRPAALKSSASQDYASPAGVGPAQSIVAFSAICAHKLVYPTAQLSFIGVRRGASGEPPHVIHCCSDQSRYDPTQGAKVMSGPAPQPLAAVVLTWDQKTDQLHAVGTEGPDLFDAFFQKYAFRFETELGAKARALMDGTTQVKAAADYSKQWQRCSA
jgi:arsenite oxidase small subunit